MHCPKCQHSGYSPEKPCKNCTFSGDAALIEELAYINWLLNDLNTWGKTELLSVSRKPLQEQYEIRKQDLEIALGLRMPPLSDDAVQQAWVKLIRYEILDEKFKGWLEAGDIHSATVRYLLDQLKERIFKLTVQLEDYQRPEGPLEDADQLKIWQYILEVVNRLGARRAFINSKAEIEYREFLQTEIDRLEISLGLRPQAVTADAIEAVPEKTSDVSGTPISPSIIAPAAKKPKVPLRERLWSTLLSERTLQAILFLGIFLLFTAAISFVIWGWRDFSAPLRVAIPAGFTIIFFALGWVVRRKTALYRSGIALSAIAALLIPIDLYTIYVNIGNPPT